MMPRPWNVRHEQGAVLVVSVLVIAVLMVVGSGSLTTSRIETHMARHDVTMRQAHLAAEYALALGESTIEQALSEQDLQTRFRDRPGFYNKREQPACNRCAWDERDSVETSVYFRPLNSSVPLHLPPLPPFLHDAHERPRLMLEHKDTRTDNQTRGRQYGNPTGLVYMNVSAHGARAKWTALDNGAPDDRPGGGASPPTYSQRYQGTRVILQSVYAKRYK